MEEFNERTLQVIRKDKPNSFEYGKSGNRAKLYFNLVSELKPQIMELNELMLDLEKQAEKKHE